MYPSPFNDLSHKRILVTGASSGIGRDTAILLSQLGASLVLVGRSQDRLTQVLGDLAPGPHAVAPFDLTDTEALPKWMLDGVGRHGRLAGLVHCAGVHAVRPLRTITTSTVEDLFRLNVTSAFLLAKSFRQKMVRAEGRCSIVFLSSVIGLVGQSGVSTYASSKAALLALTRSLALELSTESIRVNAIAAGVVHTPMSTEWKRVASEEAFQRVLGMHPLGLGEPRDVANAISFLLSDASRWVTGSTLVVDGGYTAH